jgi:hypothetical protein
MKETRGFVAKIKAGAYANWSAIAYTDEQEPKFVEMKKVYIHVIHEDYTPLTENGIPVRILKNVGMLEVVGFTD